ncbi:MAG TPA: GspH/FimT family pseudopilin [Trueperaceae bacterium]
MPYRSPVPVAGYTLVELLVVLAIAGLLTTWYVGSQGRRHVDEAILALRSQTAQARHEAIARSLPVAVLYRPADASFVTLAGRSGNVDVCESGEEVARLELSRFPGVAVARVPAEGLVWLPSGSGRTCSGSGAFNTTMELHEGRVEARVIVSRAGRIRSEVSR